MNRFTTAAVVVVALLAGTFTTDVLAGRKSSWIDNAAQTIDRSREVRLDPFATGTSFTTCFTPGQDCEGVIVSEISHAKRSILMQAYEFTSAPIGKALAQAKERGVDVRAILDKSQRSTRYSGATFLRNADIPLGIDEKPAIAHSKIFIFDQETVLTGSFNFTRAAQERNAENLIVIKGDPNLVKTYTTNWQTRWSASVAY